MAEKKERRYTLQERESALFRSALAVVVQRNGGTIEYTESEFAAVRAALGEYVMRGEVDRSGPGEPIIRITLAPDNSKGKMPVV